MPQATLEQLPVELTVAEQASLSKRKPVNPKDPSGDAGAQAVEADAAQRGEATAQSVKHGGPSPA